MFSGFLVPFITVGLAELGDKTQLAIFCLASKTNNHIRLFLGVMLAFVLADGAAILLGSILSNIIPMAIIKVGAALVFIVFGAYMLLTHKKEDNKCDLKSPFASGLGIILLSELGDKTQIASGLFAAELPPIQVFFGVILALAILSIIAIFAGKTIASKINQKYISIAAGILFISIGIFSLFR